MRAAVYQRRGALRVEARETPQPREGEVLVSVAYCGICGTDLHMVNDGWGRPGSIGGHEYTGHVVRVGPGVEGLAAGDRVAGGPEAGCGECGYCLAGRSMLCPARNTPGVSEFQGAFADFIRVEQSQLIRIPEGLSLRAAALAEPLAVALHGITRSRIRSGARVLITGAGPIGLLTLAALRARAFDDITVSEPAPTRCALAKKLGARATVGPDELKAPPMPFTIAEGAYDAVFECSGKASAVETGLGLLTKGGSLVLQGTGAESPRLDAHRVLLNELVITGAYCYDDDGVAQALELLASGRLPVDELLHPEDIPLAEIGSAFDALGAGVIAGKAVVVPGSPVRP